MGNDDIRFCTNRHLANNKVFICSALRGDFHNNRSKAECLCRLACLCGKQPYAPHVYYTRFLDDKNIAERRTGMQQGIEWLKECQEMWVFTINGHISEGMKEEIEIAKSINVPIKYLKI